MMDESFSNVLRYMTNIGGTDVMMGVDDTVEHEILSDLCLASEAGASMDTDANLRLSLFSRPRLYERYVATNSPEPVRDAFKVYGVSRFDNLGRLSPRQRPEDFPPERQFGVYQLAMCSNFPLADIMDKQLKKVEVRLDSFVDGDDFSQDPESGIPKNPPRKGGGMPGMDLGDDGSPFPLPPGLTPPALPPSSGSDGSNQR